ncbi:MAG: AAA family ATPase [Acidimicrobiales bacterium]|nr:AAA family ATPase [Acidimicrobiales bacterium]
MTEPVAAVETHSAVVVFVGDRAYKVKKPVDLGFLDFSTPARRRDALRQELALNRRLAPDVYLGLLTVHDEAGTEVDTVLVMRRLPGDRRLATLVRAGHDVTTDLDALARVLASFHARCPTSEAIGAHATVDAVRATWETNIAVLASYAGRFVDAGEAATVAELARRYLDGRAALFAERIERGHVRDGHGDLLADDIFCLDDGPRVIDCIEFDARLRSVDVLADVAFLAMDLEHLGAPRAAAHFLARYRELSAETWPESLAHHYVAERAHVRAMVGCVRADQTGADTAPEAEAHLHQARRHLEAGQVRLVLVGGGPGTGKSTLAAALADVTGWALLRSDEVRDELVPRAGGDQGRGGAPQGLDQDRYAPARVAVVYAELLARARRLLERGESVLVDASWTDAGRREEAATLAAASSAGLVGLRCTAPAEVVDDRIRRRLAAGGDPSEATPAVAAALARRADPWPGAVVLDTHAPPGELVERALAALPGAETAPSARGGPTDG